MSIATKAFLSVKELNPSMEDEAFILKVIAAFNIWEGHPLPKSHILIKWKQGIKPYLEHLLLNFQLGNLMEIPQVLEVFDWVCSFYQSQKNWVGLKNFLKAFENKQELVPHFYRELGRAHFELQEYEAAGNCGLLFLLRAQNPRAEDCLDEDEIEDLHNEALWWLGTFWFLRKNYLEAKDYFTLLYDRNLSTVPKVTLCYRVLPLVEIYLKLGDFENAKKMIALAISYLRDHYGDKHPKTLELRTVEASIFVRAGEYAQAKVLCEELVRITTPMTLNNSMVDYPFSRDSRNLLGVIYALMGEPDLANLVFEDLLKRLSTPSMRKNNYPFLSLYQHNYAVVLLGGKKKALAAKLLKKSLVSQVKREEAKEEDYLLTAQLLNELLVEKGGYMPLEFCFPALTKSNYLSEGKKLPEVFLYIPAREFSFK